QGRQRSFWLRTGRSDSQGNQSDECPADGADRRHPDAAPFQKRRLERAGKRRYASFRGLTGLAMQMGKRERVGFRQGLPPRLAIRGFRYEPLIFTLHFVKCVIAQVIRGSKADLGRFVRPAAHSAEPTQAAYHLAATVVSAGWASRDGA